MRDAGRMREGGCRMRDVGGAHPKSPRRKECEPLTRFSASAISCTASRSLPALSMAPRAFPSFPPCLSCSSSAAAPGARRGGARAGCGRCGIRLFPEGEFLLELAPAADGGGGGGSLALDLGQANPYPEGDLCRSRSSQGIASPELKLRCPGRIIHTKDNQQKGSPVSRPR